MSGDFQVLDLILFALVAAFLVLRLRSVLGRRDGHRGPAPDPFKSPTGREHSDDRVVRLPDRGERPAEATEPAPAAKTEGSASALEASLTTIKVADPVFDGDEFLSGARMAFELILNAFAAGDTATLKPLLSPEVFANFAQSIRDRQQAGEAMELAQVNIRSADIVEAYMAGRTAHVTVKFVSEQATVVRNEEAEQVEGDPHAPTEVTDYWTFARDTRSGDPNWMLVATGSQE